MYFRKLLFFHRFITFVSLILNKMSKYHRILEYLAEEKSDMTHLVGNTSLVQINMFLKLNICINSLKHYFFKSANICSTSS